MQLSEKQKTFSLFSFLHFKNLYLILDIWKKTMIIVADVFPEIPAHRNMVGQMSKNPSVRGPLDRQQGK